MLPKGLIADVKALGDEDKRRLFWMLLKEPALKEIAPEVSGLRYNYAVAGRLMEMLEEQEKERTPEVE